MSFICCQPAEEAGIGDTPNLEDQAAGHVTQGQWLDLPSKAQGLGGGRWQHADELDLEKSIHGPRRFFRISKMGLSDTEKAPPFFFSPTIISESFLRCVVF